MTMERHRTRGPDVTRILLVALVVALGVPAAAQAQSAIAGVVRDSTSGVLPGVTVEAASPALIEKVRTAVTDDQGQYKIIDLRPGTYTVTFSLPGFQTIRREGLELPANFTAPVNAVLEVGTVAETITVSGQTPVVDVQRASTQNVMTREVLDSIPIGRTYQAAAITTPAVTISRPDIGGSQFMFYTNPQVHGSLPYEQAIQIDGISAANGESRGQVTGLYRDDGDTGEVVFEVSAIPAEVSQGGVRTNMIGREGSNLFNVTLFAGYTPGGLQAGNYSDELKARGLGTPTAVGSIFDYNIGAGGPIRRDKVWFFGSFRRWGVDRLPSDTFYPAGHPKAGQKAVNDGLHVNYSARVTSQLSKRNKLMAYYAGMPVRTLFHRGVGSGTSPEAAPIQSTALSYQAQLRWTATLSPKLLAEAGFGTSFLHWRLRPQGDDSGRSYEPDSCCAPNQIAHQDLLLGTRTVTSGYISDRWRWRRNYVGSVSYVTGSHAFKAGVQFGEVFQRDMSEINQSVIQQYRNGVPSSVLAFPTPSDARVRMIPDLGIFAQDSWTIRRLTLNYGTRFEKFAGYVPEQSAPAGRFVSARHFNEISNVPDWNDWTPRLSAVYDLFGTGKTALKASVSKYMVAESVAFTSRYNPMLDVFFTGSGADQRTWTDRNGDDIAQDSEIGPTNVLNYGTVRTSTPDPKIKRPYQMEYTAIVQHEVAPRVSVTFGYFRRRYYNFIKSDNLLVSDGDYIPINVTSPLNGETITIYNLNPSKRGQVDILDTTSTKNARMFNGVDLTFNARLKGGGVLFGGVSTGKVADVNCDVDDLNLRRFCDQRPYMPYLTQVKLSGAYPLPFGVLIGAVFQSLPGIPINTTGEGGGLFETGLAVNYLVNRSIVPSLTQTQITVPLVPPGSKYLERQNQLDFRVGKTFRIGRTRVEGTIDIFNAFNANSVLNEIQVWGPRLGLPLEILLGRSYRFSIRVNY